MVTRLAKVADKRIRCPFGIDVLEERGLLSHRDVAKILYELANYMEIDGENPFRVSAYRRAAHVVENLKQPLTEVQENLESIRGIGKGTAAVIREILATGEASLLQTYREKLPSGLMTLLTIPGLGPKSVKTLYQKLNISNIEQLEEAIKQRKVRQLPGFGPKTEANLLESIKRAGKRPERLLLGQALPVAEDFLASIQELAFVKKASLAGSIRRMQETVRDIDIIVATTQPEHVAAAIVSLPQVTEIENRGTTKVTVFIDAAWPLQVDVRIVTPEQFATTLHHFTGSKEHNVRIRQIAKEKGWKVSEYGVEREESGQAATFTSEAEFFHALGLPYIPPELRQGRGETELPPRSIPKLITEKDIRGDLHTHSQWSDGHHTIRQMAEAAKAKGYEYIAITDHSRSLVIAGGLSIEDLVRQREEIDRLNRELEGIQILAGVEMDILADGRLDYPDDVLRSLDLVIASVHSSFQQDERTMTKRILEAIENPYVDIIAHPTGRLINRREAYAVDMREIFRRAAETGTALELNASPNRLDLKDVWLKEATETYGITIAVNTDAHHMDQLHFMRYGVGMGRRGWLTPDRVMNTWSWDKLQHWLRTRKDSDDDE